MKQHSDELKKKISTADKVDMELEKEWLELWKKIPIFDSARTHMDALIDKKKVTAFEGRQREDDASLFMVHFLSEPTADHGDTFYAEFLFANEARILSEAYLSCPTTHITNVYKDFFGFRGTWEEVTKKLVEINNFLTSPTPPLEFVLK